ncbi:MAG: hypothetical protein IKS09_08315 [Lachnospiraceae bacterium]|nr:hypothetical protein [Lachnospiraceae bacterium]
MTFFINEDLGPRTVKDIKVLLVSIFELAIKERVIVTNPAKEASINRNLSDKRTKPKTEEDFFSYSEAMRFLEILDEQGHELKDLFYFVLFLAFAEKKYWDCDGKL